MSSEKRILANRENAKKSTGPRTPEGKARSSRNSRKHGLYAAIAPGEDPVEFDSFVESYFDEYAPTSLEERDLVRDMALNQWRIRRYVRVEAGILAKAYVAVLDWEPDSRVKMNDSGEEREARRLGECFHRETPTLSAMSRMENSARRAYYRAVKRLDEVRKPLKQASLAAPVPATSIICETKPPQPPAAHEINNLIVHSPAAPSHPEPLSRPQAGPMSPPAPPRHAQPSHPAPPEACARPEIADPA